jgi:phenylalanyl-tRNA synthetase alpha chain
MHCEEILNSIINKINNPLIYYKDKNEFFISISIFFIKIENIENLQKIKNKILDELKVQLSLIKNESLENKKIISSFLNELKQYIFDLYNKQKDILELNNNKNFNKKNFFLPINYKNGSLHPITITINKIYQIMNSMCFNIQDAPEIDDPVNVFDNLNMDKLHPARADQQSFAFDNSYLIPRSQCTNFQSKILNNWNEKEPIRYYHCGHVYRCDSDATHTPKFTQFEVMYVNDDGNISTLLGFIDKFFHLFFGYEVKSRIRTSYFPFTEISYEVDILLNNQWLEIGGSGIIHKKVFEKNNKMYKLGWAFGMGIERLTMIANNYTDIRKFYNN